MNTAVKPCYLPQTDRLGLLHRGIGIALLALLLVYLSVFVSQIEPKVSLIITAVAFMIGGKRLLNPAIWPLMAIVLYGGFLDVFFPGPKPDTGVVLEHPLFLLDCVMLAALVLGGQSVRRQYFLLLGILFISLVGAVGDRMGNDMTALLPFEMPDDAIVNTIILQQGDVLRIRGFFTEAGVLGAVSLGVATAVALSSLVLIRARVCVEYAWLGLACAASMGAALLCITVTKSGFVMLLSGCVGFGLVLLVSRNPRCRFIAVTLFATILIGGTAFLALGPAEITNYLRGELIAGINPYAMTSYDAAGHSGVVTRYKCWLLAFTSIRQFPLGVGSYGLGSVIAGAGSAGMTHEMRYFFSRDNFGLKNALANLIAQTGVVGVGLLGFWLWVAFLRPIRHALADASMRGTMIAGLYGASAALSLFFLFSCELYPSMAFLLVLKCHADAVAQACSQSQKESEESIELIG